MKKMYLVAGFVGAVMALVPGISQAADAKPAAPAAAQTQTAPTTEGEFAKWLVAVLGLNKTLPVNASPQECFAVLLQNGIVPKAGWNATNTVTLGNLARVVVQSMRLQDEVKNPDQDNAWIEFLKTKGIDLRTITQALEILEPADPAFQAEATVVSTDPLRKQARIAPPDSPQLGADLQPLRMPQIIRVYGLIPGVEPEPVPPAPPKPPKPPRPQPRPPMTRT